MAIPQFVVFCIAFIIVDVFSHVNTNKRNLTYNGDKWAILLRLSY